MATTMTDKVLSELDELPLEEKEYVKEVFDKMIIEARREEIFQNTQEAKREHQEGKTKSFDNVKDLISSLDAD